MAGAAQGVGDGEGGWLEGEVLGVTGMLRVRGSWKKLRLNATPISLLLPKTL